MDYYDQRRIQIQDRAEIRRKAEVQSWIDQRFQNQKNVNVFNATNPDINLSDVASQAIEQAKEMTGIKLGDRLRQAKEQQLANLPDFQPAVLPTNRPPTPIAPPAPVKRSKSGGYVPNFATSGKAKNIPGLF